MLKAKIRDHKEHETIYVYCKDSKELSKKVNENWKTWTVITVEYLKEIKDVK